MRKNLATFLILASILFPAFKAIDSYNDYNSKSLVMDESINTFNIESRLILSHLNF